MTALFIGRFQPFHLGHLDALKQIQEKYDVIKIGIGSSQESCTEKNPYDFETRKKMIEVSIVDLSAKIQIFNIPDINDDEKWVSHVKEIIGDFDAVYSGNDYVLELFEKALISTNRQDFNLNINATIIREKIKNSGNILDYVSAGVSEVLNKL
jgi:nicotinamide-nucleotide adenylyltransferase